MRLAVVALCLFAGAAGAAERRMLGPGEAEAFQAVGRLNVAGSRFCSATLISAREVLTAAHCLYNPRTGRAVPLSEIRFVPGHRIEANAGVRRVTKAVTAPGFVLLDNPRPDELGVDIALLELDEAVARVEPFAVEALAAAAALSIVSYARDRGEAPSITEACPRLGLLGEVMIVACAIEQGMSGAPVFVGVGAGRRLVAVVSAMRLRNDGVVFGLTVLAAPWIGTLRTALAAAPAE